MAGSLKADVRADCVAAHKKSASDLYALAVDAAMAALNGRIRRESAITALGGFLHDIEIAGDYERADCVRRLIERLST